MADPPAQRDPVETLAEEFIARRRAGERPTIDEYAALYPALADQIRDLFPTITALERLKASGERGSDGRASLGPAQLQQLGDFRIVREIGRGGMGVVYEAEQESLGRRVALKVLPPLALADEGQLERFEREARIAARLHHTNIVQVYGVGEQERFHFYVMQYVQGAGLDRIIATLARRSQGPELAPVDAETARLESICRRIVGDDASAPGGSRYWRIVARIGRQVADALAYAHSQGTLHRDIKPANLLLDTRGVVWVTDFGLAKAIESADATTSGQITGTLRYAPPERFSGRSDSRCDIYSLGLTLYELLTLRPAFDEGDRSSLVKQITQQSPPRPRRINPDIPRDLETIVFKAIARDPAHRYASADALGDDLQRFLDDRPIQARPIGPIGRLWRWSRRNPVQASLAAAVALLIVAIAGVATTGYLHTRAALKREADQRARAETSADLALEALDRIFARYGPAGSASTLELTGESGQSVSVQVVSPPVISRQAAAMLEELLPYYDKLANQVADTARVRLRTATANRRVGDIQQRLGRNEQAVAAYRRAIEIYGRLADRSPDDLGLKVQIAQVHNQLGQVYRWMAAETSAATEHDEALKTLEAALVLSPRSDGVRFELARTHYLLAAHNRPDPGAGGPEGGGPPARPRGPAATGDAPADPQAAVHLEAAVGILNALTEQSPANPAFRHLLALCLRDLYSRPGQRDAEASAGLAKAATLLEMLAKEHPEAPDYRFDLSETLAMGAGPGGGLGSSQVGPTGLTAEQSLRKALELSARLVAENPYVPQYAESEAHILHRLAMELRRSGQGAAGEQYERQAVQIHEALASEFPQVVSYRVWLAAFRNSLADFAARQGRNDEASTLAEENIKLLDALLSAHGELWYLHGLLERSYRSDAEALRRLGRSADAEKADAQAQAHRGQMRRGGGPGGGRGGPPPPGPPLDLN